MTSNLPMALLLAGALLGLVLGAARGELQLARRWVAPAAEAKAGPVDRSCKSNRDCPPGCGCSKGECQCEVRR